MLHVVKRDGREVKFNADKISSAIKRTAEEINYNVRESQVLDIIQKVLNYIEMSGKSHVSVEEIQNLVQKALKDSGLKDISNAYSNYRSERTRVREIKSDLMRAISKIGVETDRDNA